MRLQLTAAGDQQEGAALPYKLRDFLVDGLGHRAPWYISVVSALLRLKEKDCELEASLSCMVSLKAVVC